MFVKVVKNNSGRPIPLLSQLLNLIVKMGKWR